MSQQNLFHKNNSYYLNISEPKRLCYLKGPETGYAENNKDKETKQREIDKKLSTVTGKSVKEIQEYRKTYLEPLSRSGFKLEENKSIYNPDGLRSHLESKVVSIQKQYDELTKITAEKAENLKNAGQLVLSFKINTTLGYNHGMYGEELKETDQIIITTIGNYKDARDEYHMALRQLKNFANTRNIFEATLWKLEKDTKHPHPAGAEKGPIEHTPLADNSIVILDERVYKKLKDLDLDDLISRTD